MMTACARLSMYFAGCSSIGKSSCSISVRWPVTSASFQQARNAKTTSLVANASPCSTVYAPSHSSNVIALLQPIKDCENLTVWVEQLDAFAQFGARLFVEDNPHRLRNCL